MSQLYLIRLLQNLYPVAHPEDKNQPLPGTIEHLAGEVIRLDADMAVLALAEGWGELVGYVGVGGNVVRRGDERYTGSLPL